MKIYKWLEWCKKDQGVKMKWNHDGWKATYQGETYFAKTEIDTMRLVASMSSLKTFTEWYSQYKEKEENEQT